MPIVVKGDLEGPQFTFQLTGLQTLKHIHISVRFVRSAILQYHIHLQCSTLYDLCCVRCAGTPPPKKTPKTRQDKQTNTSCENTKSSEAISFTLLYETAS